LAQPMRRKIEQSRAFFSRADPERQCRATAHRDGIEPGTRVRLSPPPGEDL